jgi:endonuclease/exonuclease/phosphatase family metal-dependent hydrolase
MPTRTRRLNAAKSLAPKPAHDALRGVSRLVLTLIVPLVLLCGGAPATAQTAGPVLLTYQELVSLYGRQVTPEPLRGKLNLLLTMPFVNNEASSAGIRPMLPESARIGKTLRVVQWNVERGLEFDAVRGALAGPAGLAELLNPAEYPRGGTKRELALRQAELLKQADVIVLNEVDWGVKRTGYRAVAAELAEALGMNYAFGVEFVEVDPISLGVETFEELSPEARAELAEEIEVDPTRYKGLHGTAILSRFPLENVRLIPFVYQPHDWYADELKSVKALEKGKRKAAEIVFREKVRREVRRGGRMMLTAEIADPAIPGGRATIVATHLEDKTKPSRRRKQLGEVLAHVKGIDHAVVVAGDMNTTTQDSTPTSFKRELRKRLGSKSFWLKQGLKFMAGLQLPELLLDAANVYRKQADPTVRSVPLVATNPEAGFFEELKRFRFADGGAFDFRGERGCSAEGNAGVLSNSNQRGGKGFITTYETERTVAFIGKFKLDWVFVKPPGQTDPYAEGQSHRFAPHFGRTLKLLNDSVEGSISDHDPIVVDLPLEEPGDH